jgi:hypothetical protein
VCDDLQDALSACSVCTPAPRRLVLLEAQIDGASLFPKEHPSLPTPFQTSPPLLHSADRQTRLRPRGVRLPGPEAPPSSTMETQPRSHLRDRSEQTALTALGSCHDAQPALQGSLSGQIKSKDTLPLPGQAQWPSSRNQSSSPEMAGALSN